MTSRLVAIGSLVVWAAASSADPSPEQATAKAGLASFSDLSLWAA